MARVAASGQRRQRHVSRSCPRSAARGFEARSDALEAELAAGTGMHPRGPLPRYLVRRLLLDTSGYLQRTCCPTPTGVGPTGIEAARAAAGRRLPVPAVETPPATPGRRVLEGVLIEPAEHKTTATDRIDRVLTHRVWGTLVFAAVMLVVFQSVFVGPAGDG